MTENDAIEQETPASPASEPGQSAAEDIAALNTQIQNLQSQLAQSEKALAEQKDAVLRVRAEADNSRRRAERDVENAHKFALERFAQELLGVIDSLEMGLKAASATDVAVDKLREGTELTLKMFATALNKFNVVAIDPAGQPFNPELHQAVSMVDAPDKEPNSVVSVLQKGYTLNERLIRPAVVVVAKS